MRGSLARRAGALVAVSLALLAGAASPAAAADIPVSGDFTATGTFTFACDFALESTDGGGDWTGLGPSTFHLDWCVGLPPDPTVDDWPVTSGTFTVTTAAGTLTGTMGGWVDPVTPDPQGRYPIHLVLTITGGTGAYVGATGELVLDGGLVVPQLPDREISGTVSGTVTTPGPVVNTPTSKADCKHDGWRAFTDEAGVPFASFPECFRWVKKNT